MLSADRFRLLHRPDGGKWHILERGASLTLCGMPRLSTDLLKSPESWDWLRPIEKCHRCARAVAKLLVEVRP